MTNDFFKYLKNKREEKGYTVTEIAKKIGISRSYLSNIENGKKEIPRPSLLKKFAEALDINYLELMKKAGHFPEELNEETRRVNKEFREAINEIIEVSFKSLTEGNNFKNNVLEDIRKIENKYINKLEKDEFLTPNLIKKMARNATWKQEWIFDLAKDLLIISRRYNTTKNDLITFLKQPDITLNNAILTKEEREQILKMIYILFPDKTKKHSAS